MRETINIKIIIQSIIELLYTILGLDKITNIDNNTDNISMYGLFDHSIKSYNDFMGINGLNNTKQPINTNLKNNQIPVKKDKDNNKDNNKDANNKINMPNWAKTTK
jgi:hypothetical protein